MSSARLSETFTSRHGLVRYGVVGSGPAIVLSHGTPTSSFIWNTMVDRLKDEYRFYYLDLPGYGASAKFDGQDVRLRALAQSIAEFVMHLGLDRPHLVGHDFGAAAVFGAHLIENVEVSSITICDGVVLSPWGTPFSRHVKEHEKVFAAVPPYIHRAVLAAHLNTAVSRHLEPPALEALLEPWTGTEGQAAYYRQVSQYDYSYTEQLEASYHRLTVPVAIMWGEEDRWVDISEGRRLHKLIPHAEFRTLPDAGHFCMLDTPGLFANTLDEVLQNVATRVK